MDSTGITYRTVVQMITVNSLPPSSSPAEPTVVVEAVLASHAYRLFCLPPDYLLSGLSPGQPWPFKCVILLSHDGPGGVVMVTSGSQCSVVARRLLVFWSDKTVHFDLNLCSVESLSYHIVMGLTASGLLLCFL